MPLTSCFRSSRRTAGRVRKGDCIDAEINPGARSWFTETARELLEMTRGYLELLDIYGIGWVELRTKTPGRITYQDAVQIVAVPPTHKHERPFKSAR